MSLLDAAGDLKFDIARDHEEDDEASAEVRKKAEELQQAVANGFDDLEGLSDDYDEDLSADQYFKPPGLIGYGGATSTPITEGQGYMRQAFPSPDYVVAGHQNMPSSGQQHDGYTQSYTNGLALGGHGLHGQGIGDEFNGGSNGPVRQNLAVAHGGLQPSPLQAKSLEEMDEYIQLQVLYKARTREVERLQLDLENLKESSRAEVCSLQDQVASLQASVQRYLENYNEASQALASKTSENAELSVKLVTLQSQLEAEAKSGDENVQKMRVAEATIKMLQEQISELSGSSSLVRLKRDYEQLLQTQKLKHQDELYGLHEKIDQLTRSLAAKAEEMQLCKARFEERERQFEARLLEKADTINQLTQSLTNSQKQCHQFLENSTSADSRQLLQQFQLLQEERGKERQKLKRLEEGVDDLYRLLIMPKASLAARNPELSKSDESLAARSSTRSAHEDPESKVHLCQREVGHLRSEVLRARDSLSLADRDLGELRRKLEMTENEVARLQEKLQGRDGSETESQFQDLKDELTRQVQTLENKLCQTEAAYERLKFQEKQLLLEKEMVIRSCAEDKAQAIDTCKNSILEMHHGAMKRLREELLSLSEREKEQITREYEARIQDLNSNYSSLQQTINDVKELYVRSCEEKRQLEAHVKELASREENVKQDVEQKLHHEFRGVLQKARPVWEGEMVKKFREELERERQRWRHEFDQEKQADLLALREQLAREQCRQHHSDKVDKDFEEVEALIRQKGQEIGQLKEVASQLQAQVEGKDAELRQALAMASERESRLKQKLVKFHRKLQQSDRECKEQLLAQEKQHADKLATLQAQLQRLHIQPCEGDSSSAQKNMIDMMDKWSGWFVDCLDKVYKDICSYTDQAAKAKSCEMRQLLLGYHQYLLTQPRSLPQQQEQSPCGDENIPPRQASTPPLQRLPQPRPRTTPPERLFTGKPGQATSVPAFRPVWSAKEPTTAKPHLKPLELDLSGVSDGSVFLSPPAPVVKTS